MSVGICQLREGVIWNAEDCRNAEKEIESLRAQVRSLEEQIGEAEDSCVMNRMESDALRAMLNAALDGDWEHPDLSAYRVARSGWSPGRATGGTDQGDASLEYFNEWKFAYQVAEERADTIDALRAQVKVLTEWLEHKPTCYHANSHYSSRGYNNGATTKECSCGLSAALAKVKEDAE